MPDDPLARGILVVESAREEAARLAKEAAAMLRALDADVRIVPAPEPGVDFTLLIVDDAAPADDGAWPDLAKTAGAAVAVAADEAEGRAAVVAARRRLRARGAVLGARQLVFAPGQFGVLGLESDGARERLENLLRLLVNDGERLRLKREGWEDAEE